MRPTLLTAALLLGTVPALAADHPDFTGAWKLDLAACDSLDEVLTAQGASWVERKAAASVVVTQNIQHKGDQLQIRIDNTFKSREETMRIGAGWEEKENEKGRKVRLRHDWSADGKAVVTRSEIKLKDGSPADFLVTRTLEDGGKTMVQLLELKPKDGKSYKVRRVFRKQEGK